MNLKSCYYETSALLNMKLSAEREKTPSPDNLSSFNFNYECLNNAYESPF